VFSLIGAATPLVLTATAIDKRRFLPNLTPYDDTG
jgi:hypothetical protein